MQKLFILSIVAMIYLDSLAQKKFQTDMIPGQKGNIEITFIGHGSLMIQYDGKNIQIDPYSSVADYSQFPKADLILITHHHSDHLDLKAIEMVGSKSTQYAVSLKCKELSALFTDEMVMRNGDSKEILGFSIQAVPAYNIMHKRANGTVFHPKGEGNGYIVTIGGKTIYIAGDTENIPEMKTLKNINIAFLPMNLPYTMTPEMVADAVKAFRPAIVYPYHYGETDTNLLIGLLMGEKGIEVRIRDMK
jgi:L-ascorbate metabolism protein UlaG (beta-lactamase superfamily)